MDKKDRGRGADLAVHPKAFGEKVIAEGIDGAELLLDGESGSDEDEDGEEHGDSGESDDAMESDGEDGSELIEDEEMDSDVEADHSDEAGSSDLEGKSYSIHEERCVCLVVVCMSFNNYQLKMSIFLLGY